jgi:uncharacterized protein DUF2752
VRAVAAVRSQPSLGAALAGLIAPLVAARLLWEAKVGGGPVISKCALLHTTGIPCPACGATRAFVYFVHGDTRFLHYNWAWLVIWAALLAWVVLLLVRRARGEPLAGRHAKRFGAALQRRRALVIALPFAVLAVPWLVALANLGWIRA